MADLIFTWNETISVFGLEQTNNWGEMSWGDNWGNGENVIKSIEKLLEESLDCDDEIDREATFSFSFDEEIQSSDELENIKLTDAEGYSRVYLDSTNAAIADMTLYSEASESGTNYVEVTNPSTSWTEQ